MLYVLYALLVPLVFLVILNGFLRGARKAQIDAFLSVALVGLLITMLVFEGWRAALVAVGLILLLAIASRPVAASIASKLSAIGSEQVGRFPGLPPRALSKISLELGSPLDTSSFIKDIASGANKRSAALDALYVYCQANTAAQEVINQWGVTRTEFNELYYQLLALGAGQWACGHWVAASALAYPEALRYLLQSREQGQNPQEIAFALGMYFERGTHLG